MRAKVAVKAGAMSLCHEKASGLTGKMGVKENQ
jgi:hypothetical protein